MKATAKAVVRFLSADDPSFSFNENDVILIIDQDDKGWFQGSLNGKQGWFPSSYVEIISDESASDNPNMQQLTSNFSASLKDLLSSSVSTLLLT
jgi:hypothetical protein